MLTLSKALKEQHRDRDAWIAQIKNIALGTLKLVCYSLGLTTIMTSGLALMLFSSVDMKQINMDVVAEIQTMIRGSIRITGVISFMGVLAFNGGGFCNVFKLRAEQKVAMWRTAKGKSQQEEHFNEDGTVTVRNKVK